MTKLIRTGFFREMPHSEPSDPSLAEARTGSPCPHQSAIASYLKARHLFILTPDPATCSIAARSSPASLPHRRSLCLAQ